MLMIEEINNIIKRSLIEKEENAKIVFKSIKNTATAMAKEAKSDITDEIVQAATKKEMKQLKETLASTPEDSQLHKDTAIQMLFIKPFIPAEMSEEELTEKIKAIIATLPADANFGIRMKACMTELKGVADGNKVKAIVQTL